ncbi:MAG: phosphomannomutase/phosphoglucomutase [Bacteroidales bacterium]|jgi:phosphomannomutase|nr:phosphomannomutase/phosphoglucomutase [Bacteroidales bacterium]
MRKAFKAYDIRGVYNRDFTGEDVYKIGFFLPGLLGAETVLVGHDVRISSPEILEFLCRGITDAGADVQVAGKCTTPMIYWATAKYNFKASVMITASHNPAEYNGLKISREEALPVGFDTGLSELLEMAEGYPIVPAEVPGTYTEFDFKKEYLLFLNQYKSDTGDLKIAIDCSNGMGSLLIRELFGEKPLYIYDTLDGTFPNHQPNPLEQENVEDLRKLVIKEQCDIGLIFDGDADRVMFVDEKGHFIQPDMMIAVLAGYFAGKGFQGPALQDIRTSRSVTEYVESQGFSMHMWRVGRAYAALKLREINGIFGGELAGHYYFRDFYYSDSAYLAALIILGEVKKFHDQGVSLSALINSISKYAGTGEMNFPVSRKQEAMDELKQAFMADESPTAFYDFDGYRIEFRDWWFNVRPSNTEPYLRFLAEAGSAALLESKTQQALRILAPYIEENSHAH